MSNGSVIDGRALFLRFRAIPRALTLCVGLALASVRVMYNFRFDHGGASASMELKAQALERVLEALSPALSAELDRVVAETREALEQEFQERLRTAVLEAEAAAKASAEAQITCVVAETKETTEKEVTAELEERFRSR